MRKASKFSKAKIVNEMRFKFPSLSVNESVARSVVAAFCSQLDPNAMEIADIKCAVSEAVTNAIVHGYRNTVGQDVLHIAVREDRIVKIEIKDHGCGMADVKQARQPLFTTDAENERSGMGFTVMESFCDAVKVWSKPQKGTVVVLWKQLEGRG